MVGTQLSWYERSQKAFQSFQSIPGLYFINENRIKFMPPLVLRQWRYSHVLIESLLDHVLPTFFFTCPKFIHISQVHKDPIMSQTVSTVFTLCRTNSYCIGMVLDWSSGILVFCDWVLRHKERMMVTSISSFSTDYFLSFERIVSGF